MQSKFPEYPFADHWLDLHGIRMHYVDEGPRDGEPVLMLHGNPTWSFFYRRLASSLMGTHRVIVPDHVGMGLSDKPGEAKYDYTLARRVKDIEKLVEHLELKRSLTLIVHDWGGMIGMAWAQRHPEMVKRIVAMNTGAFRLPKGKGMPWQLSLARTPLLGAILIRGLSAFSRGAVKDCVVRPLSAEVKEGYCGPYDSWGHRLAVHRFIQDIPLKPGDRAYGVVAEVEKALEEGEFAEVPALLCWGMRDFVFDGHFLARWEELFPQAEVHRFEDAGHYVLEDAHERIIPLVKDFLARDPGEGMG